MTDLDTMTGILDRARVKYRIEHEILKYPLNDKKDAPKVEHPIVLRIKPDDQGMNYGYYQLYTDYLFDRKTKALTHVCNWDEHAQRRNVR